MKLFWTDDLPRPFSEVDPNKLSNLSAAIPYDVKKTIKSVCPKKGVLNQITQCFFAALFENLKANNITYYSPDNEQYFIELARAILTYGTQYRRLTPSDIVGQAIALNDGTGTSRTHAKTPRIVNQHNTTKKTTRVGAKRKATNKE